MTYIRKVTTKSGATAVQLATKIGGRIVKLKHLGSAHSPQDLQALIALAQAQLFRDQPSLFPDKLPPIVKTVKRQFEDPFFHTSFLVPLVNC